jgi:hypothetical protein
MSETDDSIFMTEDDYCEDREERLRAEITKLTSQLEEARRGLKVALHALKNVDGPFASHDGEQGIFLAKEHHCTCWDAEQTLAALLHGSTK